MFFKLWFCWDVAQHYWVIEYLTGDILVVSKSVSISTLEDETNIQSHNIGHKSSSDMVPHYRRTGTSTTPLWKPRNSELCPCFLLQKEFAVVFEYTALGFSSVMQMASSLPDVFHCVQVDGTDCKFFDARKNLPPEYAKHNMKNNICGKLCLHYESLLLQNISCIYLSCSQ